MPPAESLDLLELFGISAAPSAFTADLAATVAAAEQLGFPVVLKTAAPDILHKTEAGVVMVGAKNAVDFESNDSTILDNARHYYANTIIDLIQIHNMRLCVQAVINGAVTDRPFGKLTAF